VVGTQDPVSTAKEENGIFMWVFLIFKWWWQLIGGKPIHPYIGYQISLKHRFMV
jgi:hypothetical protein